MQKPQKLGLGDKQYIDLFLNYFQFQDGFLVQDPKTPELDTIEELSEIEIDEDEIKELLKTKRFKSNKKDSMINVLANVQH